MGGASNKLMNVTMRAGDSRHTGIFRLAFLGSPSAWTQFARLIYPNTPVRRLGDFANVHHWYINWASVPMSSFDVVSEVDLQEVRNAVDQANREIGTRFDFKGVDAHFELSGSEIQLRADTEFRLGQMMDILRQKLVKRKVDLDCLDPKGPEVNLHAAKQQVVIRQGVDSDLARKLVKAVKDTRLKVQAQIQGDQLRVSGNKRDDLQQVIATLRAGDWGLPLQFSNFRD